MYRIDKTKFRAKTIDEVSNHFEYYRNISWKERFKILIYLNSIAFRIVGLREPKMNKSVFRVRSWNNG